MEVPACDAQQRGGRTVFPGGGLFFLDALLVAVAPSRERTASQTGGGCEGKEWKRCDFHGVATYG